MLIMKKVNTETTEGIEQPNQKSMGTFSEKKITATR